MRELINQVEINKVGYPDTINVERKLDSDVNVTQNNRRKPGTLPGSIQERGAQNGPVKAKLIRDDKAINIERGLDFSNAVFDEEMGKRCIVKEEHIDSVERSPILECKHRQVLIKSFLLTISLTKN